MNLLHPYYNLTTASLRGRNSRSFHFLTGLFILTQINIFTPVALDIQSSNIHIKEHIASNTQTLFRHAHNTTRKLDFLLIPTTYIPHV